MNPTGECWEGVARYRREFCRIVGRICWEVSLWLLTWPRVRCLLKDLGRLQKENHGQRLFLWKLQIGWNFFLPKYWIKLPKISATAYLIRQFAFLSSQVSFSLGTRPSATSFFVNLSDKRRELSRFFDFTLSICECFLEKKIFWPPLPKYFKI